MSTPLGIGISTYTKHPSEEEVEFLKANRKSTCDKCGTPNSGLDYFPMYHDDAWFNVCCICHYTHNLDQVPSIQKGKMVFLKTLTQEELSVFMRIYWSVEFVVSRTKVSIEERQLKNSLSVIENKIRQRELKAERYFGKGMNEVETSITYLNLLPPEKYNLRERHYKDLRWIPNKDAFEKEIAWWSSEVFNILDSGVIRNNIVAFIDRLDRKEP